MSRGAAAVIDAAIAYGASRWLRGVHDDPNWAFRGQYVKADDRRQFLEFLHQIVLYDRILLDNSSVAQIGFELEELFAKVNAISRAQIVALEGLAPTNETAGILRAVCQIVREILSDGGTQGSALAAVPVPWAYQSNQHKDYEHAQRAVEEAALPQDLIPLVIFAYRGVAYSGYACHRARTQASATAYLASPGRMAALDRLLNAAEIRRLDYSRKGYADLLTYLPLPPSGFDFTHLPSVEVPLTSSLGEAVGDLPAREALRFAINLRATAEAQDMRGAWQERLWKQSNVVAVGGTYSQGITGSTIQGNVSQTIIIAQAEV